jgi:hypothetical protein
LWLTLLGLWLTLLGLTLLGLGLTLLGLWLTLLALLALLLLITMFFWAIHSCLFSSYLSSIWIVNKIISAVHL